MSSDSSRRCSDPVGKLDAVAEGSRSLSRREQRHVESCAACQLELGSYARLLGALQGLRSQVFEPEPGLLGSILARVSKQGEQQSVRALVSGRRVAYASGIAVAAAAGLTGLVVFGRHKNAANKAA